MFTCEQISKATGIPVENIQQSWPILEKLMNDKGWTNKNIHIAMIATVATETNITVGNVKKGFLPINELGSDSYFETHYGYMTAIGKRLGNTAINDGAKYHGRGFIQTTGKANYTLAGKRLGLDLVNNPDLILEPTAAAKEAINYFESHHVDQAAICQDWVAVREKVNGGTNGWEYFKSVVDKLLAIKE
jgi:predicted chitinase